MDKLMFLLYFVTFFILAIFFTLFVKKIANHFGIIDKPDGDRKIHKKATPLLGGLAIFLAYFFNTNPSQNNRYRG